MSSSDPTIWAALGTAVSSAPKARLVDWGAAGGIGALLGVIGGVDDPIVLLKFIQAFLGSMGVVLVFVVVILLFIMAAGATYFINKAEQDEERWNNRFESLRQDTRDAFQANAAALDRVTTMLESAVGLKMPNSDSSSHPTD